MKTRNVILGVFCFIIGFVIALCLLNYDYFITIMKNIKWTKWIPWLTLIGGSLIPIIINYFMIKKQEVIKLKVKIAERKLCIVLDFKNFDLCLRATCPLNKNVEDLNFKYEPTREDLSSSQIRGSILLCGRPDENGNVVSFEEWKFTIITKLEQLNRLDSKEISNYVSYFNNYLLNISELLQDMPKQYYEDVSVAVKNDFFNFSYELNEIINNYINKQLYKFENNISRNESTKKQDKFIEKKLYNTNLLKYSEQLKSLKSSV